MRKLRSLTGSGQDDPSYPIKAITPPPSAREITTDAALARAERLECNHEILDT
jgi:hypothetical protein